MADEAQFPLANDAKFMLGEINSTVKSLPVRLDRLEQTMTTNLNGLNARVMALEEANARRAGALSVIATQASVIASLIASLCSGVVIYVFGKH